MKEIKAYIRESKLDEVGRALRDAGAHAVTAVKIVPMGAEVEPEFVDISQAVPMRHFAPMVKLELVCEDRQVGKYVDIVREHAQTGDRGDGVIFVSDVEQAV
ncbi:MAG: P-II family nitrogen regulator, partial [Acidobacteria bacterium]|nr:P-II family nitrogen regulator [Acidobacteriota bacterium]